MTFVKVVLTTLVGTEGFCCSDTLLRSWAAGEGACLLDMAVVVVYRDSTMTRGVETRNDLGRGPDPSDGNVEI